MEERTQIPQKISVKNNGYFHKSLRILKIKFLQDHGLTVFFQMYNEKKKVRWFMYHYCPVPI